MHELSSIWTKAFDRASGDSRRLVVRSECDIPVPPEIVGWWQDVAEDRDVSGTLRVLEFNPSLPFGEAIQDDSAVVYISRDERVIPHVFLRSNGAHEIRHLEQRMRPWLVDWFVREKLIQNLLKADGLKNPDADFFNRHHEELPDEADAFMFEKEVAGFDARPFAAAVRKALNGGDVWPNPSKYVVQVTRPLGRSKTLFDRARSPNQMEKQASDSCPNAPDGKHAFLFNSPQCLRCRKVFDRR
jgi:hypothetical protein